MVNRNSHACAVSFATSQGLQKINDSQTSTALQISTVAISALNRVRIARSVSIALATLRYSDSYCPFRLFASATAVMTTTTTATTTTAAAAAALLLPIHHHDVVEDFDCSHNYRDRATQLNTKKTVSRIVALPRRCIRRLQICKPSGSPADGVQSQLSSLSLCPWVFYGLLCSLSEGCALCLQLR